MSKKCQELISGLLWTSSDRRKGSKHRVWAEFGVALCGVAWRRGAGCDSVIGMPLLLDHFPPLPALVVVALVCQTEYVSFPL